MRLGSTWRPPPRCRASSACRSASPVTDARIGQSVGRSRRAGPRHIAKTEPDDLKVDDVCVATGLFYDSPIGARRTGDVPGFPDLVDEARISAPQ